MFDFRCLSRSPTVYILHSPHQITIMDWTHDESIIHQIQLISIYSTITQSLELRPNTSGEYISSALAGGTT